MNNRFRALGIVLALLLASSGSVGRTQPVRVDPYAPLSDAFHAYGDSGAGWQRGQPRTWTGGDSTFSVALPDGRVLWLFSDSFLAPTDGCGAGESGVCHRRRTFQPFVNNSFVIQSPDGSFRTMHGGTQDAPAAIVRPPAPHDASAFYWLGDATVEGDRLHVFLHRYPKMPGVIPPQSATDVATFTLPDLTLVSVDEGVQATGSLRPWAYVPGAESPVPVIWGAGVLETEDHTYVYGTEEYPLAKHLHVARAPRGKLLDAPWEYFDGARWSTSPLHSRRIASNVAGELSVVQTSTGYRMIASEIGIGDIYLFTAPRPEGPWSEGQNVYAPPEAARGAWAYNAHEHPHLSTDDTVVISYNVNGRLDGKDIYEDVHVYRARFIEVRL